MPNSTLSKGLKDLAAKPKKAKVRYGPFYLTKENVESLQKHCRDREVSLSELLDSLILLYLDSLDDTDDKKAG